MATFLLGEIKVLKKINVIGTTGSGKTTFSKKLAEKLDLAYIQLDDLLWLDDWQETPDEPFFEKLRNQLDLASEGWVVDGNYTRTQYITWEDVETVIWLDMPFHINLFQSVQRAVTRALSKEKLWENSNNQESFKRMLSRDSILWWMIKTYRKNRKKYLERMCNPKYAHIQFIHLKSRKEVQTFLQQF